MQFIGYFCYAIFMFYMLGEIIVLVYKTKYLEKVLESNKNCINNYNEIEKITKLSLISILKNYIKNDK